jgi:hypothetical protein
MNTAGILGGIISTSLVPLLVQHFGWLTGLSSGAIVALLCTGSWIVLGRIGFGPTLPGSVNGNIDSGLSTGA